MDNKEIKGIIFDYGGTIDTNGVHWMDLIWESYLNNDIPVSIGDFREVYIFVEKQLESKRFIKKEYNFHDVLKPKSTFSCHVFVVGSLRILTRANFHHI